MGKGKGKGKGEFGRARERVGREGEKKGKERLQGRYCSPPPSSLARGLAS